MLTSVVKDVRSPGRTTRVTVSRWGWAWSRPSRSLTRTATRRSTWGSGSTPAPSSAGSSGGRGSSSTSGPMTSPWPTGNTISGIIILYPGCVFRMESTGRPGKVHLSESTYQFLKEDYYVEEGEEFLGKTYCSWLKVKSNKNKLFRNENIFHYWA